MPTALPPPPPPATELIEIRPQAGPQEKFLSTPADIAIYGGAAGAGKSFGLLMEPLRHVNNPQFGAVIFRRTMPQIKQEGGLWITARELYGKLGASFRESPHPEAIFPGGARIRFSHMEGEHDYTNWDGSQIPLIAFDQLESFTWRQFWYMLSRNRSACGVKPYVRATCNPDPDHWLRRFMAWWIDEESGYPIEQRSGVIRYFVMRNDETHWAFSPGELIKRFGDKCQPKSFTFIPGRLEDNPALMANNPEYIANLDALPHVDRMRLRGGNWNIRYSAGDYFQSSWFEICEQAPPLLKQIRYWDRAATPDNPEGSWTAGVRMGVDANGCYWVIDVVRMQGRPGDVAIAIDNTASQDTQRVPIGIEQDPGQAGVAEAQSHVKRLAEKGYAATVNAVREGKAVRVKPYSSMAQVGGVKLTRGPWNTKYLQELQNFDGTKSCMADQVDASSGAFYCLTKLKRARVWGREAA